MITQFLFFFFENSKTKTIIFKTKLKLITKCFKFSTWHESVQQISFFRVSLSLSLFVSSLCLSLFLSFFFARFFSLNLWQLIQFNVTRCELLLSFTRTLHSFQSIFQEFQFVCFSLHTLSHKLIMLIVVFDVANLITKIFIIIDWMVFAYFFFLIFCWRNLWNGLNCFISKIISRKTDKILDSTTNFVNFPKQRTCGLCSRKIEIMNFVPNNFNHIDFWIELLFITTLNKKNCQKIAFFSHTIF